MFKYLGVFCVCFLLSGARGDFLDDLKHFGDQALHTALDTLSSDGVKTLVSSAVSAAGTGQWHVTHNSNQNKTIPFFITFWY